MPILNCPKCSKENDAAMAFCIFCGAPMKAANVTDSTIAVSQATSQSAPTAGVESVAPTQGVPFLCPSCNKSDPLNGKFCVLCGVDIAAILVSRTKVASYPQVPMAGQPAARKVSGEAAARAIAILLAIAIGGALGVSAGRHFAGKSEPPKPRSGFLPKPYPPFSKVVVSSRQGTPAKSSESEYIFGITDKDGKFEYANLKPGSYDIAVGKDKGIVTVDDAQSTVVSIGSR